MTEDHEEYLDEELLDQESNDADSEGLYEHFYVKVDKKQLSEQKTIKYPKFAFIL